MRRIPTLRMVVLAPLLVWVCACKIEPIEELELREESPLVLPTVVRPFSSELPADDRSAAEWDAGLQRHLGFLTSPELGGRRPGTPGAELTVGHVISVLQSAGLSPNGPDLGWTQGVGVRVADTHGLTITVQAPPPEKGKAPPPQRFEEGLWLQHRGSAGPGSLRLRPEGQPPLPPPPEPPPPEETPPPEQLRLIDPAAIIASASPLSGYREAFESAWHDGMSVAVLPIPGEDAATLGAAERWREPEVQSLRLGRDPPAALDLQGFVAGDVYQALLDARSTPGAVVGLEYETTERWFENANVIGRLAGGRRPEQAIVVVTHWDAGGLSEPLADGGGELNAGSLAVLLSVAEMAGRWRSAGRRPDRSIVFVAEAAGSLGHRGIDQFIEASGIRPANIVAVVCLEQLGGPDSDLLVVDGSRSTLFKDVTALEPTARSITPGEHRYGHAAFLELRVPAITLTRPALSEPDGTTPSLSMAALRRDAELTFRVLWDLADRAEVPRLVEPESEAPPPTPAAPPPAPAPAVVEEGGAPPDQPPP
ncbi:M28 family peptidase [Paraliomyxa miuraensis]|uniref:M28 family peptidase n=1 Tax=Paraliomyxa miuraensis TaxID=376150 RepID=UPI00225729A5|nr:M28 family peptidase [Paraliomyxa miuraensis]MCX4246904.1 M28 family peptidase [Paraliomyxa miuraensis]